MYRKDILKKQKEIKKWIFENASKSKICRELNCRPVTLNSYLSKMKITYSGNKGNKGYRKGQKRHVSFYLYNNGPFINTDKLKKCLIRDGLKKHKCEKCKLVYWFKELIPLELHHTDGNRYNNELKNLKLFCPNCHSLTYNYAGKANKR